FLKKGIEKEWYIVVNKRMDFWNMCIRIIFLSQSTFGILGNIFFMFYYLVLYYKEHILKPTDFILMNLMAANALIILSEGVPNTMASFGLKQFFSDFGCNLILYIDRFSRSVSIGTTCLLSVFQAITISPREYCWKNEKLKPNKHISCSIALLWIFYMLIHLLFFVYAIVRTNSKNVTRKRNFAYCSIGWRDEISDSLYAALVVGPEVILSVLMAWSSSSMIVILYRHKHRVQHIRSTPSFNRTSPESRVTQHILVLVSNFLTFYTLSSILRGCIALLYNHSWWLVNITRLTSLCFPCFGPFVFMRHYSIVSRLGWWTSEWKSKQRRETWLWDMSKPSKIIFLSQTIFGILGNIFFMFNYLVIYYKEHILKPTDFLVMSLMAANALIILSKGVPNTMAAFALKLFFNDFRCSLLLYIDRFSRSVSIGTTSLLSVFQAITISPRECCWKNEKLKPTKHIGCSIALLWIFYMLIHLLFFVYAIVRTNSKNVTRKRDFAYCSIGWRDEISDTLYAALVVCPEVLLSVLMVWSSSSMIVILYRHKHRVQHIRSTPSFNRTSPESRVTQNILALVSTFLAFYTLSSILRGCIALLYNQSWWLVNITRLTSLCFPCFGPFVFMRHYSILS
ncbi:vomeronasal type-1 receptor 4-like, partial [Sigmodon hispidus]